MVLEPISVIGVTLNEMITNMILALPSIIYFVIILIVGWIVAAIVRWLTRKILRRVFHIDSHLKKHGLHDALGDTSFSKLAGTLVFWWIMLLFIGEAAAILQLGVISEMLMIFVTWAPNLLYGIIILVGGLYFADFITDRIKDVESIWADRFGWVLEPVIIFFFGLIALDQMGFNVALVNDLVRILFMAFAFGAALAIGLAFGLGLKDEAGGMWKNLQKELNKKR